MSKRRFGRVRRLPSGRWQARYQGPDGIDRAAPETFATKTDAEVWLTLVEAEIRQGEWIDPEAGKVQLAKYARTWIEERPGLRPKTIQLYLYLLRKHLSPVLGGMLIADIQPGHVRRWRKTLLDNGVSAVTVAKAYRLLKAILNTAADDGTIRRNPCRIKGAGQEDSPERPVLTISQVYALADAVGQRYRALVLLATFSSLRWGELGALRRCDIDLEARTVRVARQLAQVRGGGFTFGPPKSRAGMRVVPIPEVIIPAIQWHLSCFALPGDEGLVFTSPAGRPLHHTNFRRRYWLPALKHGRSRQPALSRPEAHRKHPGRHSRGDAPRADGPHGPRQRARRPDLPPRQRRTTAGHRRHAQPAHQGRAATSESGQARPGCAEAIGHATGTAAEQGFVAALRDISYMAADLEVSVGAPSAIRTRGLLLRRQSLYPLSYRGLAAPQPARLSLIQPNGMLPVPRPVPRAGLGWWQDLASAKGRTGAHRGAGTRRDDRGHRHRLDHGHAAVSG